MPATRSSTGLLLAISLVWGSTWIANGVLVDAGSALHLSVLRYLLAGAFLVLLYVFQQLFRRLRRGAPLKAAPTASDALAEDPRTSLTSSILRPLKSPSAHTLAWLGTGTLLGFSMFALPELLLLWASGHGAGAWTPMIYAALPLGLLLVSGELRAPAVLGLSGMLLLLNGSLPVSASKFLWVLPIAAAVALQGGSLLFIRRHLEEAASVRCMLVQMVTATLVFEATLQLWPEPGLPVQLRSWPVSSLGALCFLAGPATAAAYPLYYRLLRRLHPAQIAVSAWVQTMVAVAESALLLKRLPSWPMISAACLLIICTLGMLRKDAHEGSPLRLSTS